jgi:hypothetical protein
VWAEVHHGRVSRTTFLRILDEEIAGIRAGDRRVQVRWEGEAARWYPIAAEILRRLVLSEQPPEFVTELVLPFTFDVVRAAPEPWEAARTLCPSLSRTRGLA